MVEFNLNHGDLNFYFSAKVEQNGTVEPEFPPVNQNGNSVPSSTQSANNTTASAPPQRQQHNDYQRENGQKERYNRK